MDFLNFIMQLLYSYKGLLAIPVILHLANALAIFLLVRARGLRLASALSWLPVGQDYALGALADSLGGRDRFFRGESFYRHILTCARLLTLFSYVMSFWMVARGGMPEALTQGALAGIVSTLVEIVPFVITAVRLYVLYRIFDYYKPDKAAFFAFLSAFLSFLTPIFLFVIRPRRRNPQLRVHYNRENRWKDDANR